MKGNRNIILLGACFSALCQGVCYSMSVFFPELMALFGTKDTAPFSLVFSLHTVALPVGSILIGLIEKRLGAKGAYLIGGLCFAAAFLVAAAGACYKSVLIIQIGFGVMTGLGSGMIQGIYLRAVSMWFPDRRGFAVGLVMAALGASALIFAPLAQYLLDCMTVCGAFLIFGLLIGVLAGTAWGILRFPENYHEEAFVGGRNMNWRQMIKSPLWFGVIIVYAAGCFGGLLVSAQTKLYGMEAAAGCGAERAAELSLISVLIFSIVNCVGRFLWAAVSDRIGRMEAMILMLICGGGALGGLYFLSHNYMGFSAMLIVIGLCYGGFLGVTPPVVADYFGAKHQTINLGITDLAFAAAGLAAPMAGAAAGLGTGCLIGVSLCIAGICAGLYTRRKHLVKNT